MLDLKELQEEEAGNFETPKLPAFQDTHTFYMYVCMYTFLIPVNTHTCIHA